MWSIKQSMVNVLKLGTLFYFLFSNKMLVIRAEINKMPFKQMDMHRTSMGGCCNYIWLHKCSTCKIKLDACSSLTDFNLIIFSWGTAASTARSCRQTPRQNNNVSNSPAVYLKPFKDICY